MTHLDPLPTVDSTTTLTTIKETDLTPRTAPTPIHETIMMINTDPTLNVTIKITMSTIIIIETVTTIIIVLTVIKDEVVLPTLVAELSGALVSSRRPTHPS